MKRFCVICGKKLDIIVGRSLYNGTEIISGGYYFKNIEGEKDILDPKTLNKQTEYWECEECYNE